MVKVRLTDYSGYKTRTGSNGGDYSYTVVYLLEDEKIFRRYTSSAEFPYCGKYGSFNRCRDCNEVTTCYGGEYIGSEEMLKEIRTWWHRQKVEFELQSEGKTVDFKSADCISTDIDRIFNALKGIIPNQGG